MTTTTQALELTVCLEEGTADLARAAGALGDGDVNVRGYAYDGERKPPVARFVADGTSRAREVLEDAGFDPIQRPAVVTAVPHEPGELSRVAGKIADREEAVASSYVVVETTSGLPQLVFTFAQGEAEDAPTLRQRQPSTSSD